MTATQPCTAGVKGETTVGHLTYPIMKPCGEPVAELGPCRFLIGDLHAGVFVCHALEEDHGPNTEALPHPYQGRLVHVTLGPCECGHSEEFHDRESAVCIECQGEAGNHPYVPTVTELDVGHEAEVGG